MYSRNHSRFQAIITKRLQQYADSIAVLLDYVLSFMCMCMYFEVLNRFRKQLRVFEQGYFYRNSLQY